MCNKFQHGLAKRTNSIHERMQIRIFKHNVAYMSPSSYLVCCIKAKLRRYRNKKRTRDFNHPISKGNKEQKRRSNKPMATVSFQLQCKINKIEKNKGANFSVPGLCAVASCTGMSMSAHSCQVKHGLSERSNKLRQDRLCNTASRPLQSQFF